MHAFADELLYITIINTFCHTLKEAIGGSFPNKPILRPETMEAIHWRRLQEENVHTQNQWCQIL